MHRRPAGLSGRTSSDSSETLHTQGTQPPPSGDGTVWGAAAREPEGDGGSDGGGEGGLHQAGRGGRRARVRRAATGLWSDDEAAAIVLS